MTNLARGSRRGQRPREQEAEPEEGLEYNLPPLPGAPLILPREEHNISRKNIDSDAMKILARLLRHGHRAFLVGGGVRDLLLGKIPKDFDISTDADPETIRSLFRNSRIIGRRFRINHIFFQGNKIFEVSTFRANGEDDPDNDGAQIRSDNTYGDPETDAHRRDLTINGLFYDMSSFSVIDYVGGIEDLRNGIIRVIGDPETRFREDPVRMIRAVRHAARTGFQIEPKTLHAIIELQQLIKLASPARVFEEMMRELTGGYAEASFRLMQSTGLLPQLLPPLADQLEIHGEAAESTLFATLRKLDSARKAGADITMAVAFCSIFVGNFPESAVDASLSEEHRSDVRSFWKLSPFGVAEPVPEGAAPGGMRRIRSSFLERSVELLLKPLGVSRKERERIPQILAGRYALLALFQDGGDQRSILGRVYFRDSLNLLKLTAHTPIAEECVAYWEERASQKPSREGGEPRGRRGGGPGGGTRRRSRRGRRRGGTPREAA